MKDIADVIDTMADKFKIADPLTYNEIFNRGRADCLKDIHRFANQESYKEGFKRGIEKGRADAIDEFVNELIKPSNYERFDFDDCLDSSDKANYFFKYVFAMAEKVKTNNQKVS